MHFCYEQVVIYEDRDDRCLAFVVAVAQILGLLFINT